MGVGRRGGDDRSVRLDWRPLHLGRRSCVVSREAPMGELAVLADLASLPALTHDVLTLP